MGIERVAVVFDDRLRPETTGGYVRRALQQLVEVVHFQPGEKEEIPSGFDLYLSVDDDTEHALADRLRPLAYWAIDTHRDFEVRLERARRADFVFAAQRDGADRLRHAGIESAMWLPLACDPEVHYKHDAETLYDVAFVGHLFPGPRADLLELLEARFPKHFIGRAFFDEMARIYSASRVVFNRSIGNDVNMRVFEALACGSLLVTNDLSENGLAELFRDGEHLVTYRDGAELVEKVAYYLEHEGERERIAAAGRVEVLAKHMYRHRMERMLCESVGGRTAVAVAPRPSRGLRPPSPMGRGFEHTFAPREKVSRYTGTDEGPVATRKRPGLASVIIPCFNQLKFTRHCLRALGRHTRGPWELVVIDNGSSDGTGAYLAGVQDGSSVPVTVISNDRNIGFPAAINQGLSVAQGESLVLLNNDAVVTDRWLDQLVALAEMGPRVGSPPHPPSGHLLPGGEGRDRGIGLVGPMSNYASPPQLVGDVGYRDLDEMQAFARRWRDERRGQWFNVGKLSGFCLLMKRAVYETIGGLDERFGLGFFDDDDLAVRARRAGFELAVAHDLFVHHFGSRTFVGAGIDAERLLEANGRRFEEKWGTEVGRGVWVKLAPWLGPGAPGSPLPLRERDRERGCEPWPKLRASDHSQAPLPTLSRSGERASNGDGPRAKASLTMIVKNEEGNLPRALGSVAGLFDEIVVVDTGSADRTKEIAADFGARVFEFPWIDDFAAARNAALEHATGDYAFWLDADDVVEPPEREKLRSVLASLNGHDQAAYVVRCACDPDTNGGGGQTVVDHIRLFPLQNDVRWTYRVHEQILPALRRASVPVRWTDIIVRHTGYSDPALRERKLQRDEQILRRELAERPEDPFVLFNLGSIAIERQDWQGALDCLRFSLCRSAPTDSITRKLFALIARCHQMFGDLPRALAVCAEGLTLDPDDAEILFRKGLAHRLFGQPTEAEGCWRHISTLERPEQFSSLDVGIYGHLTRRNLAALVEERGDIAEAGALWRAILAECPGDAEAAWCVQRLDGPVDPAHIRWLIPGSRRRVVPMRGPGDFDPYLRMACAWTRVLDARVVVELGVRAGASTRAFLAGVHETGGELWGVDLQDIHGISDPRFHFLLADAAQVADRWEHIDLLHIDTDPHTEEQTRRWFALYASKCRAIALHDTHHPAFGVGAAVRDFVAGGEWTVHEYWGNPSGWTVLTRPGEPSLEDEGKVLGWIS